MSKPIKSSLFRFVTLRNPQLIAEQEKDPGFVFFRDGAESEFYEAVKDDTKHRYTKKLF